MSYIEPSYHMVGNVCIYDVPFKVDWEEWCDNHDGCILILNEDFDFAEERIITVYAFSNDERFNGDVYMYFRKLSEKELEGKCILNPNTGGGTIICNPRR